MASECLNPYGTQQRKNLAHNSEKTWYTSKKENWHAVPGTSCTCRGNCNLCLVEVRCKTFTMMNGKSCVARWNVICRFSDILCFSFLSIFVWKCCDYMVPTFFRPEGMLIVAFCNFLHCCLIETLYSNPQSFIHSRVMLTQWLVFVCTIVTFCENQTMGSCVQWNNSADWNHQATSSATMACSRKRYVYIVCWSF